MNKFQVDVTTISVETKTLAVMLFGCGCCAAKQVKMAQIKQADSVRSNEAKQLEARAKVERAEAIRKHRAILRPWRGPLYSLAAAPRDKPPENFELAVDISSALTSVSIVCRYSEPWIQ